MRGASRGTRFQLPHEHPGEPGSLGQQQASRSKLGTAERPSPTWRKELGVIFDQRLLPSGLEEEQGARALPKRGNSPRIRSEQALKDSALALWESSLWTIGPPGPHGSPFARRLKIRGDDSVANRHIDDDQAVAAIEVRGTVSYRLAGKEVAAPVLDHLYGLSHRFTPAALIYGRSYVGNVTPRLTAVTSMQKVEGLRCAHSTR